MVGSFVHFTHLPKVPQKVHKGFLHFSNPKISSCPVMSLRSGKKKKKSPQKNIYSVHFSPIQGNTAVHKGQWEDCTFKSHLMSFCGERECSPCVRPDINIVLKFQKQSQCYGLRAITRPIILPLTIYSLCGYRGTCFCCAARSRLHKSTLLA